MGSARMVRSRFDLEVWEEALDVAKAACRLMRRMRRAECRDIADQIRAAALSLPVNIAEGRGREGSGTCLQYLECSRGSLGELETHLRLAQRVQMVEAAAVEPILAASEPLGKTLNALINSLRVGQTASQPS